MLHGGASVDRPRGTGPSQRRYRSMQDLTAHRLPFQQRTLPPERRRDVVHQ